MTIGDWITVIAVIVALAIGAGSIIQTRSIQKKQNRQSLLNEISDWAITINNWHIEHKKVHTEIIKISDPMQQHLYIQRHMREMVEGFEGNRARNAYVNQVAGLFGEQLKIAVSQLIKNLKEYSNFLDKWAKSEAEAISKRSFLKREDIEKADSYGEMVDKSAERVLEEVAKIKIELPNRSGRFI